MLLRYFYLSWHNSLPHNLDLTVALEAFDTTATSRYPYIAIMCHQAWNSPLRKHTLVIYYLKHLTPISNPFQSSTRFLQYTLSSTFGTVVCRYLPNGEYYGGREEVLFEEPQLEKSLE
nr:hypothetical protein HmN_000362400 [Hymenolepis microstoma]